MSSFVDTRQLNVTGRSFVTDAGSLPVQLPRLVRFVRVLRCDRDLTIYGAAGRYNLVTTVRRNELKAFELPVATAELFVEWSAGQVTIDPAVKYPQLLIVVSEATNWQEDDSYRARTLDYSTATGTQPYELTDPPLSETSVVVASPAIWDSANASYQPAMSAGGDSITVRERVQAVGAYVRDGVTTDLTLPQLDATGSLKVGVTSISGTAATNVAQWGGAVTSLGQKVATSSVPVVLASNQSSIPVAATVSGTAATNVAQWGGVATSLGQKTMAASVPVVLSSDQASIPVAATVSGTAATNVAQWGGVATSLGQKTMAASVPVVLASDQSTLNTQTQIANTYFSSTNLVNQAFTSGASALYLLLRPAGATHTLDKKVESFRVTILSASAAARVTLYLSRWTGAVGSGGTAPGMFGYQGVASTSAGDLSILRSPTTGPSGTTTYVGLFVFNVGITGAATTVNPPALPTPIELINTTPGGATFANRPSMVAGSTQQIGLQIDVSANTTLSLSVDTVWSEQ